MDNSNKTKVATVEDFGEGYSLKVIFEDKEVAIFKLKDGYYAIGNLCTHRGGQLCNGRVENDIVICPNHGGRYEVKTGQVVGPPPVKSVEKFNVTLIGNDIYLDSLTSSLT